MLPDTELPDCVRFPLIKNVAPLTEDEDFAAKDQFPAVMLL